jgi:hypothetical protein
MLVMKWLKMSTTLFLAVAACGKSRNATPAPEATAPAATTGSEQPSAPATPVASDPCAVFTVDQIAQTLGFPVGAGKKTADAKTADGLPLVECTWEQGSGGGADYSLTLEIQNYKSVEHSKEVHADSRVTAGPLSFVDVSGVGDEAIFAHLGADDQTVTTGLYWRSGSAIYQLKLTRLDKLSRSAMDPKLQALADLRF